VPACKVGHDVAPDLLFIVLLDPMNPARGGDGGRRSLGRCCHGLIGSLQMATRKF
jgi:hypothetical protein